MNGSVYFGELYNEKHIELYDLIGSIVSPVAFIVNTYGLYVIIFNSAAPHLAVLRPHLLFHQVILCILDLLMFHVGKPVMLFPAYVGFSLTFLRDLPPLYTVLALCVALTCWVMSCSSSLQILLFKHQNLWPPGSRMALSTRVCVGFCIYYNCWAAVPLSVPLYLNMLDMATTKEKIKKEMPFLAHLLDQSYVLVVDKQLPSFYVLAITLSYVAFLFAVSMLIGSVLTIYGVQKQRYKYSKKTYQMQMKYVRILLIQLIAPLGFSFIPAACVAYLLIFDVWVPIAFNLVMLSMGGMHGFVATSLSLLLNDCYRKPLLNLVLYPFHLLKILPQKKTRVDDNSAYSKPNANNR